MTGDEIIVNFDPYEERSVGEIFKIWAKMHGCPLCNSVKVEINANWFECFDCNCNFRKEKPYDVYWSK